MSREVILTSSPETQPAWPIPPEYVPLWSTNQIREWANYIGGRKEQYVQWEAYDILTRMKSECDKIVSELQFSNWQLTGLLKGARQTSPDATLKDEPVAQ